METNKTRHDVLDKIPKVGDAPSVVVRLILIIFTRHLNATEDDVLEARELAASMSLESVHSVRVLVVTDVAFI
ncbi:hypothetical protein L249_2659 [Ophiocordyceps polyrhachis-furcata BCC 54312]|uniref:Uncharacterized protein n=1 Tax=Ophiocordyceps polyrhachis-furcata BCC 54312 TaxID=1330021 RepID=A0A367LTM4_9HYPO|nr:hypothetical protein L249_2659 [Ophiocordyceps polyrhachis-furcata BCC 54312]